MDDLTLFLEINHNLWIVRSIAFGENLSHPDVLHWADKVPDLLSIQLELCQEFNVVRKFDGDYYPQTLGFAGLIPSMS